MGTSNREAVALPTRLILAVACALFGAGIQPAAAALAEAEFTELVQLGSFRAEGVDLHAAEVISLNVLAEDNADRGGGTAHAWIDPVNPVSTGLRLNMFGGPNMSGMGGTALTRTRFEFTVVKLDDAAPDWVDLSFTGAAEVSVANSQPEASGTWWSYGAIWIGARQFAVRNYDANGIYNGIFAQRWDDVALGSYAVGSVNVIELDAYTHGEGRGVIFTFDSTVFIDPTIEVVGPSSGSYRIDYSPAIVVPEPASWLLLIAGLPLCLRVVSRRR
jgi:hypothetical protein